MRKALRVALIITIIILSAIPAPSKKWMAYADGAIAPEELWVEWRHPSYEGYGGTVGNGMITNGNTVITEMNITYQYEEIDVDRLGIYAMRAYVWSNDADTRTWNFAIYNYTAENNAGGLIDYTTTTISESPGDETYGWRTYTFEQVYIDAADGMVGADWVFFFGVADPGDDGIMYISQSDGGDTTGYWFRDEDVLPATFGEDTSNGYLNTIQTRFWGYRNTTTLENTYVGNVTHFIGRRDINYTFPATVDNELIRMTFPVGEEILNITRYNGGAWDTVLADAEYSTADYNLTHRILTIPEATINNYAGLYRVYTSTYDYYYAIGGAFYENGTSYGAVNISAAYEGGSTIYEINGTTIIATNTEITLFQWDVGDAIRLYYSRYSQEEFNIYFPEDNYATYAFEIRDLTGDLQTQGGERSFLESQRYINNTLDVVERIEVQVVNDVPLTLVTYQVYSLRILAPNENIINFGIYVSGVISNPTLIIDEIAFSNQAQITYRYVTVEVERPTTTQIRVNYNDSLAQTISILFDLEFRNGTEVYNETVNENNYQFTFLGADQYTDYLMKVTVVHETFGTLYHEEPIGVGRTFNPFPDISMIGSFGPIQTPNLLGLFIIGVLALAFSAVSAEIGGFVAVGVAFVLTYWGVLDFSYTMMGIAMAIVIGVGIVRGSQK